ICGDKIWYDSLVEDSVELKKYRLYIKRRSCENTSTVEAIV
ncbi:unnamed protein product, partial [marine sediment metagenome]